MKRWMLTKFELMVGLRRRFPDLASENFGLVKVHPSMQAMDPVVNLAKQRYVVVPAEEDLHIYVVLKLDLHPYHAVGAIIVPPVLHKERLVARTGMNLVCGPTGELCICYHNGWELLSAEEATMHDGDFIVCWLDNNPKTSTRRGTSSDSPPFAVTTENHLSVGSCASSSVHPTNPRQ